MKCKWVVLGLLIVLACCGQPRTQGAVSRECPPSPPRQPEDAAEVMPELANAQVMPPTSEEIDVEFVTVDESTSDTPIKTQVEQHIVVKGRPTSVEVGAFLRDRCSSVLLRRGYRHHNAPTNIYLYVYESQEQAVAGQGLWIGMLSLGPLEQGQPDITLREELIDALGRPEEVREGLSEHQRRGVYKEYALVERRSTQEAERRFPGDFMRQLEYEDKLFDQYRQELAGKYSLTMDQVKQIVLEGIRKQWPSR